MLQIWSCASTELIDYYLTKLLYLRRVRTICRPDSGANSSLELGLESWDR